MHRKDEVLRWLYDSRDALSGKRVPWRTQLVEVQRPSLKDADGGRAWYERTLRIVLGRVRKLKRRKAKGEQQRSFAWASSARA
jgi:hypothetical protein